MFQFRPFSRVEKFTCDNCRGVFYEQTAYSVASNWEEFNNYYTYCFNCAVIIEKRENQPPKTDKRTLNKTGRTHQLGTRVRKDFLKKLKAISRQEKLMYVEVLERALDYYAESMLKKRTKKNSLKLTKINPLNTLLGQNSLKWLDFLTSVFLIFNHST